MCRLVFNKLAVVALIAAMAGCSDLTSTPQSSAPAKPKTTTEIGEFNPAEGKEVVSNDVTITNPITGALEAYQPLKRQIAGMGIDHAIGLFQALEGRYPRDHDEFMARIIKENNLRLPNLPAEMSYQYDVENHKLVVIRNDTGKPVE